MTSNAFGGRSRRTPKMPDMVAYDQLPAKVREALAGATFNWCSNWALRCVKREGSGMALKYIREDEEQRLRESRR